MKKAVSIFLLLIFLFSTIGVIASSYSCKMQKTATCCTKANKSCCEKEVKLFKISDEYVSSSFHTPLKTTSVFVLEVLIFTIPETVLTASYNLLSTHAPPGLPYPVLPFLQSYLI